jgi:hypothetical protein
MQQQLPDVPVVCGVKRGTFHTASLTVSCSCSSCTQRGELAGCSTAAFLRCRLLVGDAWSWCVGDVCSWCVALVPAMHLITCSFAAQ